MNLSTSATLAVTWLAVAVPASSGGGATVAVGRGPPMPMIIPVAGLRPSRCALPEPVRGRRRTYPVASAHGVYDAYGDERLAPVWIDVEVGEGPHLGGVDQILFGARTTFVLPSATGVLNGFGPVENLGVPRRPMVSVYHPRVERNAASGTTAYTLPMTASVWQIAAAYVGRGGASVACLYFHGRRGRS